jgi:hypothetical protein
VKDLTLNFLLQKVNLPEMPDRVFELGSGPLPDQFSGKSMVVGPPDIVIAWTFSSVLVSDLLTRLQKDGELDSATIWGRNTFQAWLQGAETMVDGLIGIMVER